MTQHELTLLNLGNSLDDLANLDPRGYGVCKLLYKASKKYTGRPLCVNGAEKLAEAIKENDLVYIMTGFILLPSEKPETDGSVGSVLLARALVKAFGAKPVIICPEECIAAVKSISACIGLDFYDTVARASAQPSSVCALPFTKDKAAAADCADKILAQGIPKAVISIECPGENAKGIYHNSNGIDITAHEAKQDILFEKLRNMGILNISIGDLGNEIGMGAIGEYIKENIPYAGKDSCGCGCGGGITVRTAADNIITATTSDWGCYSMIAMLAYMLKNPDIMHDSELEEQALIAASRSGLVDMSGQCIPAIDGFGLKINCSLITLMKELTASALRLSEEFKPRFDKIIELNSFNRET